MQTSWARYKNRFEAFRKAFPGCLCKWLKFRVRSCSISAVPNQVFLDALLNQAVSGLNLAPVGIRLKSCGRRPVGD